MRDVFTKNPPTHQRGISILYFDGLNISMSSSLTQPWGASSLFPIFLAGGGRGGLQTDKPHCDRIARGRKRLRVTQQLRKMAYAKEIGDVYANTVLDKRDTKPHKTPTGISRIPTRKSRPGCLKSHFCHSIGDCEATKE